MKPRLAFAPLVLLLAACASTGGTSLGGSELNKIALFGADGTARFAFYYSCTGSVSQETELCSAVASDFSDWAIDHHVALKRVAPDEFDEHGGVATAKLSPKDKDLPYRVFVRFAPIAVGSVQWAMTGEVKGGYTAPKAGYNADVFVYETAGGKLAASTHLQKKSEAKQKADPTPYVHDGAHDVLAALAPNASVPPPSNY